MSDLERNRKTVVVFFTASFSNHEPADPVVRYVGSQSIQHNPDPAAGAEAFVENTKKLVAQTRNRGGAELPDDRG